MILQNPCLHLYQLHLLFDLIENGKPEGRGALTYRNGTKYVGIFKNGAWHGKGNFYFSDGEKWVGEFREDEPWNVTWYDNQGNIIAKWGNGVKIE